MVSLIMLCGTCNFALGMAVAVWLSRGDEFQLHSLKGLSWSSILQSLRKSKAPVEEHAPALPTATEPAATKDRATAVRESLPGDWQTKLGDAGIKPLSFVEAAAELLRLEVNLHRGQLVAAEQQTRDLHGTADVAAATKLRDDLQAFQKEWGQVQSDVAARLAEQHGKLGDFEEAGRAIEEMLLDQASQFETAAANLAKLDVQHDPAIAVKEQLQEVMRVLDGIHSLRERNNDLLGTILRTEGRQQEISVEAQLDAATGMPNRLGLERLLCDWQEEDPTHVKVSTLCLLDLDRFSKLNERLGTRLGDRLLAAFCNELTQFLRKDRGFDRMVRLEGQRLLLFLGETSPKQALPCVERLRQSVEAMSFDCNGTPIELTLTASIREWRHPEPAAQAIGRLKTLLTEAKQAGRNKVICEDEGNATMIEPPQYPVQSRVIKVTLD